MNHALLGRSYGPYTYQVGAEKIREFAKAIYGAGPSSVGAERPPAAAPKMYFDEAAAGGELVAPPTFCVNFAMKPFAVCMFDPELEVDVRLVVHGEQSFEFIEPARAGDVLSTVGTLAEIIEKSGKEFLTVKTVTRNQHGREVVRAVWTAVVRKS